VPASAIRVAYRFLRTANLGPLMEALRPVYTGDPDDLDAFADRVSDHVIRSLNTVATDLMTYKRFKIGAFGPRATESETFYEAGRRNTELHYWCQVEYPTAITMTGKFKVDIAKRWAEAVKTTRDSNGKVPPLTAPALEFFSDALVEAIDRHTSEHLSPEVAEFLEDSMARDPMRGIDTEATMSTVGEDGEDEEHNEAASVDARFRLSIDRDKASVSAVSYPSDGNVIIDIKVPVKVTLKKIVSPFDNHYMRP
jgi:hypothetical protein